MYDSPVGQITHYDGELSLAVLALTDVLHEREWLHIVGLTTDLVQPSVGLCLRANAGATKVQNAALACALKRRSHRLAARAREPIGPLLDAR